MIFQDPSFLTEALLSFDRKFKTIYSIDAFLHILFLIMFQHVLDQHQDKEVTVFEPFIFL